MHPPLTSLARRRGGECAKEKAAVERLVNGLLEDPHFSGWTDPPPLLANGLPGRTTTGQQTGRAEKGAVRQQRGWRGEGRQEGGCSLPPQRAGGWG